MSKVLSQEEIDSLLNSFKEGKLESPSVGESRRWTTYDFRRALHFSKDHFRVLQRTFDQFSRHLANYLGARLRTGVIIQVESVDELPYEEFSNSIARLTVLQLMELEPLQGRMVIEFNMQVVFAMLDHFMGGVGQNKYEERGLTEIEEKLFHNVIGEIRTILADSLSAFVQVRPVFHAIENNPQFVQIATPNESVLLVTLNIKVGEASGLMNICIPYISIEELTPKFTSKSYYSVSKPKDEEKAELYQSNIDQHVKSTEVNVSVTLGETTLPAQEVLNIEVGDVISLNQSIHKPLVLMSNDIPVFIGNVGILPNSRYALKIVEEWKEGKE